MAKSLTNLSIRVNLPKEQDYKVKEEVVILWDRIIFFIGAVVLLLALIAGGVIWFAIKDDVSESLVVNEQSQLGLAEQVIVKSSALPGEATKLKVEPIKPVVELKSEVISPAVDSVKTVASANSKMVTEPTDIVNGLQNVVADASVVPKLNSQKAAQQDTNVSLGDDSKVITSVKDERQSGPAAEVVKESEHLLRAVLTTVMKGRKPADQAASILYVPKDQLITVYFFTELQGLGKQEIHYEWFRNDERVARVKVRPRFETTDNYSSKYINYNMRGNWRVTAKTIAGELLATANFEVR